MHRELLPKGSEPVSARRGVRQRAGRALLTAVVTILGTLGALVAGSLGVSADAGNPILGTIRSDTVAGYSCTWNAASQTSSCTADPNAVTVFVRGEWSWLSHKTDCNFDRSGAGLAVIWNDSDEPGALVSNGSISAYVGVASKLNGDTYNSLDLMVHPADRGNQTEGYTGGTYKNTADGYTANAAGGYPSGQQFFDPAPSSTGAATSGDQTAWKAGCGREPLTATDSPNGGGTVVGPDGPSGTSCGNGAATCSGHPWGSWGYEHRTVISSATRYGYFHTYRANHLPPDVCVNFYDPHGGGKFGSAGFQRPGGVNDLSDTANGDNSIKTNAFNPDASANCVHVSAAQPASGAPSSAISKAQKDAGATSVTCSAQSGYTHDAISAVPADFICYRLTYVNAGSAPAGGIVITDNLPAHASYVAGSCTSSCLTSGTPVSSLVWDLGSVAAGRQVTLYLEVRLDAGFPAGTTVLTNTVVVQSGAGESPHRDSVDVVVVPGATSPASTSPSGQAPSASLPAQTSVQGVSRTQSPAGGSPLANTGAVVLMLAALGVGIAVTGLFLLRSRRRGEV